ncbi:MAG: hypothetical protein CMP10_16550 [Zetaproteobacteria bacterium]|nr:hypothetical protein [Pseudobdellovibrionaceae bacterium]
MFALLGSIGFTGAIVNDSLIMVDAITKLDLKRSHQSLQNIIEGALTRFRPIFLTTISTIIGLLPSSNGIIGVPYGYISAHHLRGLGITHWYTIRPIRNPCPS